MMRSALVCLTVLPLSLVSSSSLEASAAAFDVRLRSTQPSYLLGEPVQLRVVATNVSNDPIECGNLHVDEATSETEVFTFISYEGGPSERYRDGIYGSGIQDRIFVFLHPGESREYRSRLLFTSRHPSKLAFEKPGRYSVKVHYPLFTPRPGEERELENFDADSATLFTRSNYERHPIESNTLEVTIREPKDADAKLWQVLRREPYLRFLQAGWYRQGEEEILLALARLLRSNPKSGYAPTIRHALAIYYKSFQSYDDLKQREQLREMLGIESKELFPDDKRLDVVISPRLTKETPLPDVITMISDESGVPLDASPELNRIRLPKGRIRDLSLRTFMKRYGSPVIRNFWQRRGEGYVLSPAQFPDDRRLGSGALLYFPDPTPLADVLRRFTQQRRVPFEASPELQGRKVQLAVETDDRAIMRRLAEMTGATWVRRGNGYSLTRKPEKAEPALGDATKSNKKP